MAPTEFKVMLPDCVPLPINPNKKMPRASKVISLPLAVALTRVLAEVSIDDIEPRLPVEVRSIMPPVKSATPSSVPSKVPVEDSVIVPFPALMALLGSVIFPMKSSDTGPLKPLVLIGENVPGGSEVDFIDADRLEVLRTDCE